MKYGGVEGSPLQFMSHQRLLELEKYIKKNDLFFVSFAVQAKITFKTVTINAQKNINKGVLITVHKN